MNNGRFRTPSLSPSDYRNGTSAISERSESEVLARAELELGCACHDFKVTVNRDCDHLELELRCRLRFAKGLGPPWAGPFSGLG
jgi:hypothetical protein